MLVRQIVAKAGRTAGAASSRPTSGSAPRRAPRGTPPRRSQPAQVGDVLAQRELAVHRHVVEHRGTRCTARTITSARRSNSVRSSSVHQSRSAPVASNCEPWSSNPWVISWPMTVPIAAVVHRVVRVGAEERRLEDAGREHDLVEQRVVVRVDDVRRAAPTRPCRPAAPGAQLAAGTRTRRRAAGSRRTSRARRQRRVVAPLVGVADLERERRRASRAPPRGSPPHPRAGADRRAHRAQQVLDEVLAAVLGRRREGLRDVELRDCSPMSGSRASRTRFQRGFGSCWPLSVLP